MGWLTVHILRKRPTSRNATIGFPAKWRLRSDCRNSHYYRWPVTTRIWVVLLIGWSKVSSWHDQLEELPRWVVRRHQYGISAVVPQTSFPGENVGCFFTLLFKDQMSVNLPSSVSPQFHPLLPIHFFPSRSSSLSPVRSPVNQAHCEREPASLQHWIPVHHPWWAKSQEHCWQLTRALAVGENVHCISKGGPLLAWAQTRR